ncbi:tetratricopeptide repeat protein [Streptomyces xylophagus]|uniref:tetratricopeptide repeat protein n=1 Tax=Streptomyces xylophagus TaxID=285514 RepID=UPI0005BDBF5C
MAPRENDNETPAAAEREWQRLWEQGEESGGGDGMGTGPGSGVGAEAVTGPEGDQDTGSVTEPGVEQDSESVAGPGTEQDKGSTAGPGAEQDKGSTAGPGTEQDSGSDTAPTGDLNTGSRGEPTGERSAESVAETTGEHGTESADEPTDGPSTDSATESPETSTTTVDDAAPAPTPVHGNADVPAPSHSHSHSHADESTPSHNHTHDDGSPSSHSHTHDDGSAPSHSHTHDNHHHTAPDDHPASPALPHADDERIAAVRRVGAAGRRWRAVQLAGCAALLAVAMTAGAIAIGAAKDGGGTGVAAASSAVSPELLASGSLDASIAALQAHLRTQPKDFDGWATLGLAYVEQARTKGDPSRYPQAQAAFTRSLKISPHNENALEGRAALAAARHEFKEALTYADEVLKENPYSERALCSRIDALVELGRYADASKAADLADARKPGIPVFTRYAYVHELRGDVSTARRVLEQALAAASSPGDISYVAGTLGQLAWNQGDYKTALDYYGRALAADENYLPALEGRARAQAALGDRADAIKGMELVVSRYPLPQPLVELGELYESRGAEGDKAKADDQYALVDAWIALARANGVNADLDTALAAADHGDVKSALKAARAEWARRHTVHTADALAWALHVNGRDKEALPYARQATATGYHNASFIYHLGMIELATGHKADGRAHLTKALKLNPGFSPLGASKARKALEATK